MFSHDVTAAMLVSQNNETMAKLVSKQADRSLLFADYLFFNQFEKGADSVVPFCTKTHQRQIRFETLISVKRVLKSNLEKLRDLLLKKKKKRKIGKKQSRV